MVIKVPETVYRPPFQLPVVEEEAFDFVYDQPKPEPFKPLESMNHAEKAFFNTELELYEAEKQNAVALAKQKWLARKRLRQQAYIESLQREEDERQSMSLEEQRQREYEQALREKIKREEIEALEQEQKRIAEEREAETKRTESNNDAKAVLDNGKQQQ